MAKKRKEKTQNQDANVEPTIAPEKVTERNNIVHEARWALKGYTLKAADVLAELMNSGTTEQIRRGAANDILTHTMKFMEIQEIEERLTNIEKQLKGR